jgi:predicted ArsR family transcriptional regulator
MMSAIVDVRMSNVTEQDQPGPGPASRLTQPAAVATASVLANPGRRRIAETLGGAPNGLTVGELVGELGDLHHNAIRNHLHVLARAGIVAVERNPPSGRGRPTERFVLVDPEAIRIAAQRELTRMLVMMLVAAGVDDPRARAFGEAHGHEVVTGIQRKQLFGSLARLGFAPHETTSLKDATRGVLELRLDHCPFAEAVLAPGGTIVCALHQGLLEGAVGAADSPVSISCFEPRDPVAAGCLVRFEGVDPVS